MEGSAFNHEEETCFKIDILTRRTHLFKKLLKVRIVICDLK